MNLEVLDHDRDALARALAESVAGDLAAAVAARGAASLVVSGGSTPRPLFAVLSGLALPWEKVTITLADERWVPVDDDASNEALVRRRLLVGAAAGARFVGLKNEAATPEAGRDACGAALAAVPRPFDVVVLGMGGDGHTASLFPGAAQLAEGLATEALCLPMRPPAAPHPRMSLSLRALLDSRRLVVHVTGDDKWQVYRAALADGPVEDLPIRAVLRGGHPDLGVWWAP